MPLWLGLALLAPFIISCANVFDKYVLQRYVPNIYFYSFWIGLMEVPVGVGVLLGTSFQGVEAETVWGGVLSGLVRAGSILALLAAFRRGQLARVVPIHYSYPLVVAPMSAVFLGEELTAVIWGAIILAVLGAVLVSWQGGEGGLRTWGPPAALGYAVLGAVLFATANVLSKHFLEEAPLWQFYGASRLGFGVGMLSGLCTAAVRRGGLSMARNGHFLPLVVMAEIMVSGAVIATLAAIDLGPVSLVSAVAALQPTVVLIYSLVLARLAPLHFGGWVTLRSVPSQAVGICAITSAVVVISLQ